MFEDKQRETIVYLEVELDAKSSKKARAFVHRAKRLYERRNKPVQLWMVSSSEKWITSKDQTGVKDYLEILFPELIRTKAIQIRGRISPLILGASAFNLQITVGQMPL